MKIVQLYVKNMEKADYITLLGKIENYARLINSLFVQYKPHDVIRAELEGRKDGLYSSFVVLKNLMIMLYPFAPQTMESVWSVDELGTGMNPEHSIKLKKQYFRSVEGLPKSNF